MLTYQRAHGSTDVSVVIRIIDSTDGTPETGVVFDTAGIDLEYRREGAASTDITEATLAALTTAHTDGGFLHIGNGYYRLDLPDAACAAGVSGVLVHGTVTGMVVIGCYIHLGPAVADLTHVSGSAVSTSTAQIGVNVVNFGGTSGTFASGRAEVNVSHWKGTAAATVDAAGYPVVTIKDGTGQGELNIAAGVVDANITTVAGSGVDTGGAGILNVNVIQVSGDATAADRLEAMLDGTGGVPITVSTVTASGNVSLGGTVGITGLVTLSDGASLARSTVNGSALTLAGNGTGSGISAAGGATGSAAVWTGGATSGHAMRWVTTLPGTDRACSLEADLIVTHSTDLQDGLSIKRITANRDALTLNPSGTGVGIKCNLISGTVFDTTVAAALQAEANDALVANGLDHLIGASVTGTDIADNSIIARLASKSATADWDSYDQTTDSHEALRDNIGTAGASIVLGSGALANVTAWTVNITGSLTGSVGSVTGAVGSVTARVTANSDQIAGAANAATAMARSGAAIVRGTVGAASSTTSIVTSSLSPAAAVADQFKGRVVIFAEDTTTVNLRGQASDITASTAGGVLTVTALTTAPASGDTFSIV